MYSAFSYLLNQFTILHLLYTLSFVNISPLLLYSFDSGLMGHSFFKLTVYLSGVSFIQTSICSVYLFSQNLFNGFLIMLFGIYLFVFEGIHKHQRMSVKSHIVYFWRQVAFGIFSILSLTIPPHAHCHSDTSTYLYFADLIQFSLGLEFPSP